ncbi:MAG: alpha/beta hydrolase, partial [Acidimicrobiia bacterium]|nr:alpha/beta hydrolase [Acidimicrobiia bacterium]
MLRFLSGIVVAMLVVVGAIWLLQRRLIYFPAGEVPPVGEQLPGWEEASFETSDGLTLHGWYTPPPEGEPVVVVFTGNAG